MEYSEMKKEICRYIGAYCKRLRREAGVSQHALAAELGCYQSNITKFEKNGTSAHFLVYYLTHFTRGPSVHLHFIDHKWRELLTNDL